MVVYKIDEYSTVDDIEAFYYIYYDSFPNLCLWEGHLIINLAEYIKPTSNIKLFIEDIIFLVKNLEYIIYYTHNDEKITSISFIQTNDCYTKIIFLCGNQETRGEKIDGKSQGVYMLDFIFNTYKDNIILIQPATPQLIPYYIKYKKPNFPYDKKSLNETYNFLIYGNLSFLKENCFTQLFRSISVIDSMVSTLQFDSINDLYNNTHNITSLKDKLITKLDFLVKTKQMKPNYYEQILDRIISIKFYDIEDILLYSKKIERNETEYESKSAYPKSGGRKKVKKTKRKQKINRTRKNK